MNRVDQAVGATGSGQSSCVLYAVKASSRACVVMQRKASSQRRRRNGRIAGCIRPIIQAIAGVAAACTSSEWVGPRWWVKSATSSPRGTNTSRSGSVPRTAPHTRALRPACRPRTPYPTAAPRAAWVSESTGILLCYAEMSGGPL